MSHADKADRLRGIRILHEDPDVIVIGKPVNMNGTYGEKVEKVTYLGELIRTHTDTPIDFFDERMTTVRAHQILQESGVRAKNRKQIIDSLAAELILQGYMDMKRNKH